MSSPGNAGGCDVFTGNDLYEMARKGISLDISAGGTAVGINVVEVVRVVTVDAVMVLAVVVVLAPESVDGESMHPWFGTQRHMSYATGL